MARNKAFDYDEKLETVRNLFWEKGYKATSMHDIVDTLQLNRSSVYNTYGNKHTLFLKCLANYAQMKTAQYRNAVKNEGSPFEVLSYAIHDVVNQTIKDKKACLIVRTILELGDSDLEAGKLITANAKVLEGIFRDLIEKAQAAQEIKKDVVPEVGARFILAAFGGFYEHYILSGSKMEVEQMVDFMLSAMRA
ncbi:TetR/AcrR family transcriptional regulator [Sphingobacterium sp. Mn56C]|uniref:TetR/AcrR family transcriptional regulator n=1 Tax=Sphingobacterium sp. Mn56C TaxID=3395261 RepID=UPI003BD4DE14